MSTENWIDLTQTKFTVTSGSVELNPKLQNILDRSMNGFERYLQLTEIFLSKNKI